MPDQSVKDGMKDWESLDAFFSHLNSCVDYVVLRNYENLSTDVENSLHPDIDVLCADRGALTEAAGSALRGKKKNNPAHQKIMIRSKKVSLDVRETGDGYYDARWETAMLKGKVQKDGMFVLDDENYFYSLLYHALIQKDAVSEDYRQRLSAMAKALNIPLTEGGRLSLLEEYMRKKQYLFTYPASDATKFNVGKTDRDLLEKDPVKRIKRGIYGLLHRH